MPRPSNLCRKSASKSGRQPRDLSCKICGGARRGHGACLSCRTTITRMPPRIAGIRGGCCGGVGHGRFFGLLWAAWELLGACLGSGAVPAGFGGGQPGTARGQLAAAPAVCASFRSGRPKGEGGLWRLLGGHFGKLGRGSGHLRNFLDALAHLRNFLDLSKKFLRPI